MNNISSYSTVYHLYYISDNTLSEIKRYKNRFQKTVFFLLIFFISILFLYLAYLLTKESLHFMIPGILSLTVFYILNVFLIKAFSKTVCPKYTDYYLELVIQDFIKIGVLKDRCLLLNFITENKQEAMKILIAKGLMDLNRKKEEYLKKISTYKKGEKNQYSTILFNLKESLKETEVKITDLTRLLNYI